VWICNYGKAAASWKQQSWVQIDKLLIRDPRSPAHAQEWHWCDHNAQQWLRVSKLETLSQIMSIQLQSGPHCWLSIYNWFHPIQDNVWPEVSQPQHHHVFQQAASKGTLGCRADNEHVYYRCIELPTTATTMHSMFDKHILSTQRDLMQYKRPVYWWHSAFPVGACHLHVVALINDIDDVANWISCTN